MLDMVYHGGACCGITTIRNFGHPKDMCPEKKAGTGNAIGDGVGFYCQSWYYPDRPKETMLERFDEYVRHIQRERSSGAIEVVLAERKMSQDCKETAYVVNWWRPILEERGFVETLNFFNSNSDNRCHVFHLVTGQERYAEASSTDEEFDPGYDEEDDYYDEDCDCDDCMAHR